MAKATNFQKLSMDDGNLRAEPPLWSQEPSP